VKIVSCPSPPLFFFCIANKEELRFSWIKRIEEEKRRDQEKEKERERTNVAETEKQSRRERRRRKRKIGRKVYWGCVRRLFQVSRFLSIASKTMGLI